MVYSFPIEVRKAGYKPWRRNVDIEKGKQAKLDVRLESEKLKYALAVETQPRDARVRILNIGPRYYSGIRLKPKRYQVEVSKEGYATHKEWVSDWYDKDYYRKSPRDNPKGPAGGTQRVFRSGGLTGYSMSVTAARRRKDAPSVRDNDLGLRLLRDTP